MTCKKYKIYLDNSLSNEELIPSVIEEINKLGHSCTYNSKGILPNFIIDNYTYSFSIYSLGKKTRVTLKQIK